MHRPHPHVYEIPTVPWLIELTRRVGSRVTLGNVPESVWDELEALGFDYVWLMGVWHRSEMGREIAQQLPSLHEAYSQARPGWTRGDVVGSPYSIPRYEPDVLVGSWEDLQTARDALSARGIGLILDFVPNHTALDHEWAHSHPEYYVNLRDESRGDSDHHYMVKVRGREHCLARGRDPFFPPWTDTLQIDAFAPEARQALIGQLVQIADHCDGVRCDMAMLLLNDVFERTWGDSRKGEPAPPETEFWEDVREALPELLLVAEAYWDTELRLLESGFDYVYDKRLYDAVLDSPDGVRERLASTTAMQSRLVRFLENHDEDRVATTLGPSGRHPAAATLLATLPGMRLFHHGQLDGLHLKLPVQLIETEHESHDAGVRKLYERLLEITGDPCFHEGHFELCRIDPHDEDESWRSLVAYEWISADDRRLVVVNLGYEFAQGRVVVDRDVDEREFVLTDRMTGARYTRSGDEMKSQGLHVLLERGQAHVFELE